MASSCELIVVEDWLADATFVEPPGQREVMLPTGLMPGCPWWPQESQCSSEQSAEAC